MVKHNLNNPEVQQNSMVLKEPSCLCVIDTLIIGLNQMKHKAQVIKYYNIKPMYQISWSPIIKQMRPKPI